MLDCICRALLTTVLGANTPGVAEVASYGGFTFKNNSELVEIINELLSNDQLATKLGKMGRKAVEEKFNWNTVVNEIEKIYFELLG
ncbi:MAG: glycosyltransferase [Archaeoglobaceae archaeon]